LVIKLLFKAGVALLDSMAFYKESGVIQGSNGQLLPVQ